MVMLEYLSLLLLADPPQHPTEVWTLRQTFGSPSLISSCVIDDDDTNKSSALLHTLELL